MVNQSVNTFTIKLGSPGALGKLLMATWPVRGLLAVDPHRPVLLGRLTSLTHREGPRNIVVAGGGVVVGDHREDIEERPRVRKAAPHADPSVPQVTGSVNRRRRSVAPQRL